MLTFPSEVRTVRNRSVSGATIVLFVNRYATLANRLVRLIQMHSWFGEKEAQADLVSAKHRHLDMYMSSLSSN